MNDKILSLLGLCRRAGKMTIGNAAVMDSIEKHNSKLIIMAEDFSKNTAKGILAQSHINNVKTVTVKRTKDQLSDALGRFCAVVSVNDSGFANKLIELISVETEQEACK